METFQEFTTLVRKNILFRLLFVLSLLVILFFNIYNYYEYSYLTIPLIFGIFDFIYNIKAKNKIYEFYEYIGKTPPVISTPTGRGYSFYGDRIIDSCFYLFNFLFFIYIGKKMKVELNILIS